MKSRFILFGGLLNFATLTVGIFVGLFLTSPQFGVVHAQNQSKPRIEQITPNILMGTVGSPLILAHQVQTDSLVVNGFDVMKLQQGIINYLGSHPGADVPALNLIISNSHPPILYTVKPPTAKSPTAKPGNPKGNKP